VMVVSMSACMTGLWGISRRRRPAIAGRPIAEPPPDSRGPERERLGVSMGAAALIIEAFGWLIWVLYVSQVEGTQISIVLWSLGGISLFGGGILGLVAAIKGDGRVKGIITAALLGLMFLVFG
jgi:hypothetical protein